MNGGQLAAIRYPGRIEFNIEVDPAGEQLVRVAVTDNALDELEPDTKRGTDYLGIFERNFDTVASIALRKFAARQFEQDGRIILTAEDVQRLHSS